MPQPTRKTINTPFLGKSDPSQYLGLWLNNFSISYYLSLTQDEENGSSSATEKINPLKQKVTEIRKELYQDILKNLNSLINHNDKEEGVQTPYHFYEYRDYWLDLNFKPDRERLVIRITRKTPRQTMISTLCRFYTNGTNLYIGVDSYFLGQLKIVSLVLHTLLLLLFGLWFLGGFIGVLGSLGAIITNPFLISSFFFSLLLVIIPGLYLYFSWFPVVKALLDGEGFMAALKHRFNNKKFNNLFDKDDILTYLKSLLPFILERVKIVLASYGIKDPDVYEKLDQIIEGVKEQSVTVNNSGFMFGIQFGSNNTQSNS